MWIKTTIKTEDIPKIAEQGRQLAKQGDPRAEQLWCFYILKDDPLYYIMPLLDYIDNVPTKEFVIFKIYQYKAQ